MSDYETMRLALVQATKRIIALEKQVAEHDTTMVQMIDACAKLIKRMDDMQTDLDIALDKPVPQMSDSEINTNACGGSVWSMSDPTPIKPIDRLIKKVSV